MSGFYKCYTQIKFSRVTMKIFYKNYFYKVIFYKMLSPNTTACLAYFRSWVLNDWMNGWTCEMDFIIKMVYDKLSQSVSHVWLYVTPWPAACQASLFVLHYLKKFAQTRVHWVYDVIQPSHPLSPLLPPALNLSQHHSLFQWFSSLHQVAKLLKLYDKEIY